MERLELFVAVAVGAALVAMLRFCVLQDRRPKIPKGPLADLLFCDILTFFKEGPHKFAAARAKKFGKVFRSNVLGFMCIISSDPNLNYYQGMDRDKEFDFPLPTGPRYLLGTEYFKNPDHRTLQKVLLSQTLPEMLRTRVGDMEQIVLARMNQWSEGKMMYAWDEFRQIALSISVYIAVGLPGESNDLHAQLVDLLPVYGAGFGVLPIYFPGTTYYRACEARKKCVAVLEEIVRLRIAGKIPTHSRDILDGLLNYRNAEGKRMTMKELVVTLLIVILAGHDTTGSVMTWAVKWLSKSPMAYEKTMHEVETLSKVKGFEQLTWEDMGNLQYMSWVFQETIRMESVVQVIGRRANKDVECEDILIPKGWILITNIAHMNKDPEIWSNPEEFEPSRFQKPPKPKTFIPFGIGAHMCIGRDVAKLEFQIVYYHFLRQFKFEVLGTEKSHQPRVYIPNPLPGDNMPIKITRRTNSLFK